MLINISESKKLPFEINQFINDKRKSTLPNKNLLVETFPFKWDLYLYSSFLGRESNHTCHCSLQGTKILKFFTDYSVNGYIGNFVKYHLTINIFRIFESNFENIDYLNTFIAKNL